jgi:hypothetical protein
MWPLRAAGLASGLWRCDERLLWHLFALGSSCLGQCQCRCGPQYVYCSQKQLFFRNGPVAASPCKGMGQWQLMGPPRPHQQKRLATRETTRGFEKISEKANRPPIGSHHRVVSRSLLAAAKSPTKGGLCNGTCRRSPSRYINLPGSATASAPNPITGGHFILRVDHVACEWPNELQGTANYFEQTSWFFAS